LIDKQRLDAAHGQLMLCHHIGRLSASKNFCQYQPAFRGYHHNQGVKQASPWAQDLPHTGR
jgi:hypothetical protein